MKTGIYKPRREAWNRSFPHSPQEEPTLLLDFSPPELWENQYPLLKSPSLWFSVTEALAHLPLETQVSKSQPHFLSGEEF